jgi:DNA/RNA endonuclease YhcR with UshA esterase domain
MLLSEQPEIPPMHRISHTLAVALLAAMFSSSLAKEASAPPKVAANNSVQLKTMVGKTITVHGKVSRANTSRSGNHFLNFYASDFSVVCFKRDATKFKDGGPAKTYQDKEVQITGKLELYQGKPQIKLRTPSQISLANTARATNGNTSKTSSLPDSQDEKDRKGSFKLKQIGETTWLSPAGLRYAGRDPEGLTRVEHVLRHAKDQPQRAGSHGVFDGDKNQALATIDEAWKLAKAKRIKPNTERDRSSYLVPMGKRVGYLGGQSGRSRGNPALKRVFIVVETDTSNVVTAFPR